MSMVLDSVWVFGTQKDPTITWALELRMALGFRMALGLRMGPSSHGPWDSWPWDSEWTWDSECDCNLGLRMDPTIS